MYLEQYEEYSHKVEVLVGASHVVSSAGLRNHHLTRRSLPVSVLVSVGLVKGGASPALKCESVELKRNVHVFNAFAGTASVDDLVQIQRLQRLGEELRAVFLHAHVP